MNINSLVWIVAVAVASAGDALAQTRGAQADWLVNPTPFKAHVAFDAKAGQLTLENGLTSRTLRLSPNAATVDYRSLVTQEQMLRATGPEARVTIDGAEYAIGGLEGQPGAITALRLSNPSSGVRWE